MLSVYYLLFHLFKYDTLFPLADFHPRLRSRFPLLAPVARSHLSSWISPFCVSCPLVTYTLYVNHDDSSQRAAPACRADPTLVCSAPRPWVRMIHRAWLLLTFQIILYLFF